MKEKIKTGNNKRRVRLASKGMSVICALSLLAAGAAPYCTGIRAAAAADIQKSAAADIQKGSAAVDIQSGAANIQTEAEDSAQITDAYETRKDASIKEEALKIAKAVKKRIELPKGKSSLEFDRYSDGERDRWSLTWSEKNGEWEMDVSCDGAGRILGMSFYEKDAEDENTPKFKYIGKEMESLMEKKLGKLIPSSKGNIKILGKDYDPENGYVTFYIRRMANGIEVTDNWLEVCMDCKAGTMREMYGDWDYDVSFPSNESIISKKEAKEIGKSALKMNLGYYFKTIDKNNDEKADYSDTVQKKKGILAYAPDQEYLSIDAKSKKVYYQRPFGEDEGRSGGMDDTAKNEATTEDSADFGAADELTEEELESIEKFDGVMDAAEAAKIVAEKGGLYRPAGMEYSRSSLYQKKTDGGVIFYWNIYFKVKVSEEYKGSIQACVDAKTGEIISYYVYEENEEQKTVSPLSDDVLKQKAEAYMKENYPGFLEKTVCDGEEWDYYGTYVLKDGEAGQNEAGKAKGKLYTFTRYENEVPCNDNYIAIGVTADKGEVYEIDRNWDEAESFEGKGGIISENEAKDYYFNSSGFKLVYEINTNSSGEKKARLVYSAEKIVPGIIRASDGKRMFEWGKVCNEKEDSLKEYSYTDIKGSEYKEDIKLLAEMGVGFNSDKFNPEKTITREDFLYLAEQGGLWRIKWETLEESKEKEVTRMELARLVFDSMGYGNIAKYGDIYYADFDDWKEIKKKDRGYAALSGAMGLFWQGNKHLDGKFDGGHALTRGEAASFIVTLYKSAF